MITLKQIREKVAVLSFIGILFIAACLLGSAIQAGAETMKWRFSTYIVSAEALPVGDEEGHFLILNMRRGLGFFENGEVPTYTAWVTVDIIKGKGSLQAYVLFTFEDGSSFAGRPQGSWEVGPKGLGTGKGTSEIFKGKGRFEGIKGNSSWSCTEVTPYSKETKSDAYCDVSATYTLPPKK